MSGKWIGNRKYFTSFHISRIVPHMREVQEEDIRNSAGMRKVWETEIFQGQGLLLILRKAEIHKNPKYGKSDFP